MSSTSADCSPGRLRYLWFNEGRAASTVSRCPALDQFGSAGLVLIRRRISCPSSTWSTPRGALLAQALYAEGPNALKGRLICSTSAGSCTNAARSDVAGSGTSSIARAETVARSYVSFFGTAPRARLWRGDLGLASTVEPYTLCRRRQVGRRSSCAASTSLGLRGTLASSLEWAPPSKRVLRRRVAPRCLRR